jgi:hypothetical protein
VKMENSMNHIDVNLVLLALQKAQVDAGFRRKDNQATADKIHRW